MADISYTPTTWADGAEGGTPINSTRLNNIESGIVDAVAAIGPNDTTADGTLKAQIDNLQEAVDKKAMTLFVSAPYTVTANNTTSVVLTPTVPSGYYVAGFITVRSLSQDAWIGQFGLTSTDQPYVQIYSRASTTINGTCSATLLILPIS